MTRHQEQIRAAILQELEAAAPDGYMITTRALLGGVRLAVSPEPNEEQILSVLTALEEGGIILSEVSLTKGRRWSLTSLGKTALAE